MTDLDEKNNRENNIGKHMLDMGSSIYFHYKFNRNIIKNK